MCVCVCHTHTHTHTYMCVCVCVCVCIITSSRLPGKQGQGPARTAPARAHPSARAHAHGLCPVRAARRRGRDKQTNKQTNGPDGRKARQGRPDGTLTRALSAFESWWLQNKSPDYTPATEESKSKDGPSRKTLLEERGLSAPARCDIHANSQAASFCRACRDERGSFALAALRNARRGMEREPPRAAWWERRERHTGVTARLSPEDYAHRCEVCGIWAPRVLISMRRILVIPCRVLISAANASNTV
jgi:hypothetical protein